METGLADGGAEGARGGFVGRIELARVDVPTTVEELVSRHSSPGVPVATVALLNRFPADGTVPAGTLAKMVIADAAQHGPGKRDRVFRKSG
jgi:hypothetical protein